MAQSVHLFLKADGAEIRGESSQTDLGREHSIECLHYEQGVASDAATGRRQYQPLVIRKRIDTASPLLIKALTDNQVIEGTFKFYRPNPNGDGTTEQFYTVTIRQGRVANVKQMTADAIAAAGQDEPPVEEVAFAYQVISWTYANGGVTHEDSVR